jgi:hypothetical protein
MNGKNKTTVQINRKKKSSEIDSITSLVYTNFPPCDNPKIERLFFFHHHETRIHKSCCKNYKLAEKKLV